MFLFTVVPVGVVPGRQQIGVDQVCRADAASGAETSHAGAAMGEELLGGRDLGLAQKELPNGPQVDGSIFPFSNNSPRA